jgi:hypothetical protein
MYANREPFEHINTLLWLYRFASALASIATGNVPVVLWDDAVVMGWLRRRVSNERCG